METGPNTCPKLCPKPCPNHVQIHVQNYDQHGKEKESLEYSRYCECLVCVIIRQCSKLKNTYFIANQYRNILTIVPREYLQYCVFVN
jgi:hypothetical protein